MAVYDIGAYEFIPETIPPVVEDVLTRNSWQADVKFYIQNDAGTYVDFSERFGNDRFYSCSEVRHISEGQYGQSVTKTVRVTVDNSDRYWDATPPAGFTTFYGKQAQLRMKLADASAEENLCTMRIAPDGMVAANSMICTRVFPVYALMMLDSSRIRPTNAAGSKCPNIW